MRTGSGYRVALTLLFIVAVFVALPNLRPSTAQAAPCGSTTPAVSTVYLPNITKTLGGPAGWVTPFYVQNIGTIQTTVEVTFYRFSDGAPITCRRTSGVAPGTSLVDNPNDDTDLPDNTQFSVVVKSFQAPVVAVVNQLQGSGASQQALSYSGFTGGSPTVYVPNVTRRFFGWDVPLVVQNLGGVVTTATATFTASLSPSCVTAHTYVKSLAIDPGKSKVIDPDFEAAHTGAPGSGLIDGCQYSVVLTSPQPIAVVANAHNDIGAPSAYSHNGIASGATTLYAPYALRTASLFSNVVVQNLGTAAVTATLTFTPLGGGVAQTFTLAGVPGGGSRPFDVRYTNGDTAQPLCAPGVTAGCLAVGEYSLRVAAPTSIAAVVLPVSSTTAAGYLASASPTQRALVPAAFRTIGGPTGWSTTLYVQSVTASQATVRWFRLDTGDLAATQPLTLVAGTTARVDPRSVSGLAENAQYSTTIDANGTVVAIAFEQAATGGDASMIFEAFALPAQAATGQPGSIRVSPTSATVATGATQQFTASVRDQFGSLMAASQTWSVSPTSLGAMSTTGLFTAGSAAGAGTVTVTSGQVSASAAVTVNAPVTTTVGGISFVVQATADSDLYMESAISSADRSTIATQAAADVAQIRIDFGRAFARKPLLYVFATTTSYIQGLQSIFGMSASEATTFTETSGVFVRNATAHAIGVNWQKQGASRPVTVIRHELTHWMERQIVAGPIPAWFNEGNARSAEFAIPNGQYRFAQNKYGAASMAATNTLFTLAEMTDQATWNARPSPGGFYQYYAAGQAVQILRADLGLPNVVRILDLMGQGQTFEAAYATVSGQSFTTFSAAYATRVRALAPSYPGIATSPDTPVGPGLYFFVYGCTPGTTVTLSISGAANFTPSTRNIDSFGAMSSYLSSGWPTGSYTISVSGAGCDASTSAVKTSSLFEGSSIFDAGETGPLEILELPPGWRD